MISAIRILEEYGVTAVSVILFVGFAHGENNEVGAGCFVDFTYVFPNVAGSTFLGGQAVVGNLEESVLKGGFFKQVPRGLCSLFACVAKAEEACAAAANAEDQTGIVVISDFLFKRPQHIGGVEHIDGCVIKIVIYSHLGVDINRVGICNLTKFEECFLTRNTCTCGGNITVGGQLIHKAENVYLFGVRFCKCIHYTVMVAVTVCKDPSFNNILTLGVSCNVQLRKGVVNVLCAFFVVGAAVNYNGIAVGKLNDVAKADHRVIRFVNSFNTDLNKRQLSGTRCAVGNKHGQNVLLQLFKEDTCFALCGLPINGCKLYTVGEEHCLKLRSCHESCGNTLKTARCKCRNKSLFIGNILKNNLLRSKGAFKEFRICIDVGNNVGCVKLGKLEPLAKLFVLFNSNVAIGKEEYGCHFVVVGTGDVGNNSGTVINHIDAVIAVQACYTAVCGRHFNKVVVSRLGGCNQAVEQLTVKVTV